MSNTNSQTWQARAAEKRKQRDNLIPAEWRLPSTALQDLAQPLETSRNDLIELGVASRAGILTAKEVQITEAYDVSRLLKELASGELTALEVTVSFCKRAAIAQQLVRSRVLHYCPLVPLSLTDLRVQTSCLTEVFFQQAQDRARHLDALREKGELAGPLHGLPISLKDSFQLRDVDATLGFVAYLDNGPAQENSCLVDLLLAQGAVLYCKTNIPQTLMVSHCDSHISAASALAQELKQFSLDCRLREQCVREDSQSLEYKSDCRGVERRRGCLGCLPGLAIRRWDRHCRRVYPCRS